MKALIIDDEPLARSIVKEYLQEFPQIEVLQECNDGFEGVKAIQQHKPDLVFLDIQMPKINGFEMLELVEEPPSVIFTTAYDEYAIKAFEFHAVDYLLKPFSKERFHQAMDKFQLNEQIQKTGTSKLLSAGNSKNNAERVVVKIAGKIRIIPVPDILYLEAADDYVKIHTADGSFLKNKTMSFFEAALPGFVRTHRSFMLNVNEVTRLEPYEKDGYLAILKSGARVPVSKSGYAKLKEILGL